MGLGGYKNRRHMAAFHHMNLDLRPQHIIIIITVMESYDVQSDNGYTCIRKGRKLLAEKRRRNRINQCLKEIRDIVCLSEQQHDPNYEKMEKAEILETTVDYLRNVRKITSTQQETKDIIRTRFHQGFSKCAEEMLSYIQSVPGVSDNVQRQLRKHLTRRLSSHVQQMTPSPTSPPKMTSPAVTERAYGLNIAVASTPHLHPSAHAYVNLSMCISPETAQNNLSDSGYGGSPVTDKQFPLSGFRSCNASDSELYNIDVRSHSTDTRVGAWLQRSLTFSQNVHADQSAPWRPW